MVWVATIKRFHEQNKHVLVDPTFGCYVMARIADDYLKGQDDELLRHRLLLLLHIRYVEIPTYEGKEIRKIITSINVTFTPKEVESIALHVRFLVIVWRRKELQRNPWKKLPYVIVV